MKFSKYNRCVTCDLLLFIYKKNVKGLILIIENFLVRGMPVQVIISLKYLPVEGLQYMKDLSNGCGISSMEDFPSMEDMWKILYP